MDTTEVTARPSNAMTLRESRLDMILAQELCSDMSFALWVWNHVHQPDFRVDEPDNVTVQLNDFQNGPGLDSEFHGETDLVVRLHWGETVGTLLVENKLWAPFQPRQADRYRGRADVVGGKTLLVAPGGYHSGAVAGFDARLNIESIVEQIRSRRDRRSEWTANFLTALAERNLAVSDDAVIAFRDECARQLELLAPNLKIHELSFHTQKQGWLYFTSHGAIIYKVVGLVGEESAMVDIYLRSIGNGLSRDQVDELLQRIPLGAGFDSAQDTRGNELLRYRCNKLNPTLGPPSTPGAQATLAAALGACASAAAWLDAVTEETRRLQPAS